MRKAAMIASLLSRNHQVESTFFHDIWLLMLILLQTTKTEDVREKLGHLLFLLHEDFF
jgi:hypothetical protein